MNATLPAITLDRIPPLPGVVQELLRSFNGSTANFRALATSIGHDPALSARVLRVVNSPFYGMSGRIGSLNEAVMVLGFSAIRSLSVAASLAARLNVRAAESRNPLRIWEHSFACALAAQRLALPAGLSADIAFTSGLLHDIGLIAVAVQAPERFSTLLETCSDGVTRANTERELFGMPHEELGARLLAAWRLPTAIVNAVRWHHSPEAAEDRMADLVHIADLVAHERAGFGMPRQPRAPAEAALARLGLDWRICGEALASLNEEMAAFMQLLGEDA